MNKWHTKECTKQYIELLEAIITQRFFLAHNSHLIVHSLTTVINIQLCAPTSLKILRTFTFAKIYNEYNILKIVELQYLFSWL